MSTTKMTAGLGWKIQEATQKSLKELDDYLVDMYTWIDQYIADAKKTFNT